MKKIVSGNSDFHYIISNNGYFVDKTMLIKEFLENSNYVVVLPRPRRFGKTLNLSMIEHFFDVSKKESASLFSEYNISKERAFCEKHQNKYPVINLSLKGVKARNWASAFEILKIKVSELYQKYEFLMESDKLNEADRLKFRRIFLEEGTPTDYELSLGNLSKYLEKHYNHPVIILLDEYDTPIISGYTQQYYPEIITFMQVFLGEAFKGNKSMHKGMITGILRVARESLFSEFNNPGVYTIVSRYFSDQFGFTKEEIKKALAYFDLENDYENIKKWYDGYQFGDISGIYNPWSIANYIANAKDGFRPYWINTGTDALIKREILKPDVNQTYDDLQTLISGNTILKTLDESFIFSDLETDKEFLWTLLVFSGYLTQTEKIDYKTFKLKIPNFEIKQVFIDIVISWLHNSLKIKRQTLIETTEHLVNNRIAAFEKGLKRIMGDSFSYFDTIGGQPEMVYQSYVLGLLAIIGDDYIIKSNRESGDGRYDIMLIPHHKNANGVVIEIKQISKRGEKETKEAFHQRINNKLKAALHQIERNQYFKELVEHGIENIIKLPIVFVGKEPFLMEISEDLNKNINE